MQQQVSKAQMREQLNEQMAAFLASGGNIETVDRGVSAYTDGIPKAPTFVMDEPKKARTPIDDVAATLDARKTKRRQPQTTRRVMRNRPRIIYDDFGEPIRKVWD